MIESFLLRALVVGVLLAGAALAAERLLAWYQVPRRWVWAAAMALTLGLPALPLWAPRLVPSVGIIRVPAPPPEQRGLDPVAGMTLDPLDETIADASDLTAWSTRANVPARLWLAMSIGLLAIAAATYSRLRAIRARAHRIELDGTPVCVTDSVGPAVVGFLRPDVIVPRWVLSVPEAEQRLIVLHEREHIRVRDNWLLALSTLGVIAMPWCVPLWWQHRRLRLAVETDCDQRVLRRGVDCREYGGTLIRTAGDTHALSLLVPAWGERTSLLARRIIALTARPPRLRLAGATGLGVLTVLLGALACDVTAPMRQNSPQEVVNLTRSGVTDRAFFNLPGPAHTRVLGVTSDETPARVRVTGVGARLVVIAATKVLRVNGDTIVELTTPAVLRVDGASGYRMVAEAMEPGTHVEIQGTAPLEQGYPRAASATGPAPMINFTDDREQIPVSRFDLIYPIADLSVPIADSRHDPATNSSATTPPVVLPRGVVALVRVGSDLDAPARVRVKGEGDIAVVSAAEVYRNGVPVSVSPQRPLALADDLEIVTPAELLVGPRRLFQLEFDKVDSEASITVRAFGGPGAAFRHLTCRHSGTIWVWQTANGAGTCSPPQGLR